MAITKTKHLTAAELIQSINKEFGANTLVLASEAFGLIKPRVSTGSVSLDLQLCGGYPEGAITLLEGDSGSSKSTMMCMMAKNYLNKYPDGIFILVNAEGTNDANYLKTLGVDCERTYFLQPDSGEQAWDASVKVALLATRVFIGVDSLDACVPLCEIEGDTGDAKYAPAAKMNNKGFRKLLAVMKSDLTSHEQRVTAIFITQLREAIGVMFGDPKKSVGGMGKKFAATTVLRLTRTKVLRTEGDTVAQKMSYGLEVEASIVKNKGWGEGEKVKYTFYKENFGGFRRGQIDNVTELIPFLLLYKVAQKSGAWIDLYGDRFNGDAQLANRLRSDDDMREKAIADVQTAHAKRYAFVEEEPAAEDEDTAPEPTPVRKGRPPVPSPKLQLPAKLPTERK